MHARLADHISIPSINATALCSRGPWQGIKTYSLYVAVKKKLPPVFTITLDEIVCNHSTVCTCTVNSPEIFYCLNDIIVLVLLLLLMLSFFFFFKG